MATNVLDESIWADGVAARLRLLQVSCADETAERRQEYLAETVADALGALPEDRREAHLEALAARFPAWHEPLAAPVSGDGGAPQRPDELLGQFLESAREIPEGTRQELMRKLTAAGWVQEGGGGSIDASDLSRLKAHLGLAQPPHQGRVADLLLRLVDLVGKVDQVACRACANLPARTDLGSLRGEDLLGGLRQYLEAGEEGDPESLATALQRVLDKHGRAMVALMASHVGMRGVPSVGREYAKWFLGVFSPQMLEDVVRAERGGGLVGQLGLGQGLESRCWKKYVQSFREYLSTQEHIDKRVKDAVADTAERIFQIKV